ncbi:acyl-CoA N-acyltransferase [Aspergillus aurantiobrunneus]
MPDNQPPLALPKTNCLIRPFAPTSAEAASLSTEANNPLIAKYMRNAFPHPYTAQDASNWITYTNSQNPRYDFAICSAATDTVIGAIGLKPRTDIHHRTLELGYWVGEGHWGRGIATEAVAVFVRWVFERFGQVVRLEAEVFDGNEGSRRVLEKNRFVCEGRRRRAVEKEGVMLDVFGYALLREM